MKNILKSYLKRLTNLTARNRSLVLLRLSKRQFIDLHSLNFLLNKPSFNIVEQLIEQQKGIPICEFLDPRNERSNEKSKQLTQISRTEKLIVEERGAEDLYVGYPMVKGKFSDGTVVRCPLLFFPVSLTQKIVQKKNVWSLEQRDSGVTFNRSLLLAYVHFNNVKLPDEWLDFTFDEFSKNSLEFRTELYETIKKSPLEINFNPDLFQNQLIDFQDIKKSDLDSEERNGELKLYPQAVLGIFPQAGSYIATDYETLLEDAEKLPSNFTDFFVEKYDETTRIIREEEFLLPLPVDASQEKVIEEAKRGKSLVVQGPPGTGKSQLIANLIADFTARGKRVLVVCQKRAALDTVYERLAPLGLAPFMALIHDFKNDRKTLFSKISDQIENIENYENFNSGIDSVLLDREFTTICREIDRTTRELDELKTALFDEQIAGKSIKEIYLLLAVYSSKPELLNLSELYYFFRLNETSDFLRKVKQIEQYQKHLDDNSSAANFWKNRKEATHWTSAQLPVLSKAIKTIQQVFEDFQQYVKPQFTQSLSLLNLPESFEKDIILAQNEIADNETGVYFSQFHKNPAWKAHFIDSELLQGFITELYAIKKLPAFYENTLNPTYLNMLKDAQKNTASFFRKFAWLNFSKHSQAWKQFSQLYHVEFTTETVEHNIQEITNAERFSEIKNLLANYEILIPKNAKEAAQKLEKILLTKQLFESTKTTFSGSKLIEIEDSQVFQQNCTFLLQLITESKHLINSESSNLSAEQIRLIEQTNESSPLVEYLKISFDYLIENDQLLASFSTTERRLLELATTQHTGQIAERIEHNLLSHWANHIEAQHPILRGVSTLKVKQLEADLQLNIQKKQEVCRAIVLVKLREKTYQNLTKNRLGNLTTYRELGHQVTKKRQLWSIRKLVENFADELFPLIPCWLASPETVSAVFPITQDAFDLVIFDEASQCYIEHGLPAALRGKQVIIAGDNQQLQPSDLYQVRYEDEQEDAEPLLEIDSLLDVASQYLPQRLLRGHYRSKSLDLISFSNQHFYNNKLLLLPDYKSINQNKPHIHYLKTEGIWDNNVNETEAQKVIEVIQEIDENLSIGVVTFNYKQAELIDKLLRETSNFRPNIRVKNIENIQGDEFDVVVFSVGYAPNKSGKLLMNFGTLNQQGGENRLNVAITRAKTEIYVVASIYPSQLSVDNSQNPGPKLLRDYLQFALDVSEEKFIPQPYQSNGFQNTHTLKSYLINQSLKSDYKLTVELPFADLTLVKNEVYESLILTDDALFYDSPSSKDAHGYLPLLLKQKGWKFERKWSREAQ